MGTCIRRPGLIALEVVWKWAFGIPLLLVGLARLRQIRDAVEASASAPAAIDFSNPWAAAGQIEALWLAYEPQVAALLGWLLPLAAVGWVLLSGVGRAALLKFMEPAFRFRPLAMLVLQAAHMALLALVAWCWFRSVAWAAATHITGTAEPELVGYSAWVIFLSLGFFTLWALVSWPLAVAPVVMLKENCSPFAAIARSFRLGRGFTAKLVEIGMVMGIVRLALMVLAMVFSAAPLPFRDELGPEAMRAVGMGALVFYFVASDFFQVVRLRSFLEFWRMFLEPGLGTRE
jgi:hypothetical protein